MVPTLNFRRNKQFDNTKILGGEWIEKLEIQILQVEGVYGNMLEPMLPRITYSFRWWRLQGFAAGGVIVVGLIVISARREEI